MLIACAENQKELKLPDGKIVTIETVKESENDTVLHLSYKNEQRVRKESVVNKQVWDIWSQTRSEAEKHEIKEALIKYIYLSGFDEKPIYKVILFEATKTENGSWTITKVN